LDKQGKRRGSLQKWRTTEKGHQGRDRKRKENGVEECCKNMDINDFHPVPLSGKKNMIERARA